MFIYIIRIYLKKNKTFKLLLHSQDANAFQRAKKLSWKNSNYLHLYRSIHFLCEYMENVSLGRGERVHLSMILCFEWIYDL